MELTPIRGLPEIAAGDDLAALLVESGDLAAGDIVVLTQKVVSKAEGRLVPLEDVNPGEFASRLARQWGKDARQIEIVLQETDSVVRMERGIVISRTRHGLVCANAGVDLSNVPGKAACLLPLDPDASARSLFDTMRSTLGFGVPILISDSFGRAWRLGIVNVCIGLAGMRPFTDYRGSDDAHGYRLEASIMATADALCAAAELVMGKVDGVAAVRIRGFAYESGEGSAAELIRSPAEDMFR